MTMVSTLGVDFTLPAAPPLLLPPLALVDLATPLIDDEQRVAALAEANERRASAQAAVSAAADRVAAVAARMGGLAEDDPARSEWGAEAQAAEAAAEQARSALEAAEEWQTAQIEEAAAIERWQQGLQYLPELGVGALELFAEKQGATKNVGSNQTPFAWYDPFTAVGRDERSLFGYPFSDFASRAQRSLRALRAHESWEVEDEFWGGVKVPTNFHLSASPATPTSTASRTITAWSDPTPVPGTVLGTAVGLAQSLAALNQAIADSDAGIGMIHATPYLVQQWMKLYPFIRDSAGRVYTVNFNLIVPGYGYPGTGPDVAQRQVTDGVLNGTTTISSASAAFTTRDIGSTVTDDDGEIPAGAYIVSVTDATHAVLSVAATASESGATLVIGAAQARLGGNRYQWAYATDQVYKCVGDARTYPWDLRQASPDVLENNAVDVRAERAWALLTNRLLRAAVLVDTETS